MGQIEEGNWGINGDGRRFDWGGEHTIQCTDNVLQNCTPKTYLILLTKLTPINSIKKQYEDLFRLSSKVIFVATELPSILNAKR